MTKEQLIDRPFIHQALRLKNLLAGFGDDYIPACDSLVFACDKFLYTCNSLVFACDKFLYSLVFACDKFLCKFLFTLNFFNRRWKTISYDLNHNATLD